jgi:hypothetical protein
MFKTCDFCISRWIKVNEDFRIVETTHKVVKLQHNVEYMFRVTAVNEVGPSPPSHNTRYIKISAPVSAEPPTIQEPLKSTVIGLKQTVTLSCVIGGVPAPEIKWWVLFSMMILSDTHVMPPPISLCIILT